MSQRKAKHHRGSVLIGILCFLAVAALIATQIPASHAQAAVLWLIGLLLTMSALALAINQFRNSRKG